jgi:hypothetical protein
VPLAGPVVAFAWLAVCVAVLLALLLAVEAVFFAWFLVRVAWLLAVVLDRLRAALFVLPVVLLVAISFSTPLESLSN